MLRLRPQIHGSTGFHYFSDVVGNGSSNCRPVSRTSDHIQIATTTPKSTRVIGSSGHCTSHTQNSFATQNSLKKSSVLSKRISDPDPRRSTHKFQLVKHCIKMKTIQIQITLSVITLISPTQILGECFENMKTTNFFLPTQNTKQLQIYQTSLQQSQILASWLLDLNLYRSPPFSMIPY